MAIINNIVKIPKSEGKINSSQIKTELWGLGFRNILRWSVVEVGNDYLKINFCCES